MPGFRLTFCCFAALTLGAQTHPEAVGRLMRGPVLSPQQVSALEARVQANPEDLDTRIQLLQFYADMAPMAPAGDPSRRAARLDHIRYLVKHHPALPAAGLAAAYVYRANGPWANPADHEELRDEWRAAVQAHPTDAAVVRNAVRFLEVEDKSDAEDVLRHAVAAAPQQREIAAQLGFLYALEILGLDSMRGDPGTRVVPELAAHARREMDGTSNAYVLAAAGTALPNLSVRASAGRPVDPAIFDLAGKLLARARQLAPGDADIQGPMPMIQFFAAAQADNPSGPAPAGK